MISQARRDTEGRKKKRKQDWPTRAAGPPFFNRKKPNIKESQMAVIYLKFKI